jgi:microcystin-dependent protein
MIDPFLSEINLFSFNFAPRGWTICAGQILPINQNQALFSLLGTTYGGNGQTTFALPDLRGRVPLGSPGQGFFLGEVGGAENVTLGLNEIPQHLHTIDPTAIAVTPKVNSGSANQRSPVGGIPATEAGGVTATYSNAATNGNMRSGGVTTVLQAQPVGGSQPHSNMQPYLVATYCIALQGVFPSQN